MISDQEIDRWLDVSLPVKDGVEEDMRFRTFLLLAAILAWLGRDGVR